MLVFPVEVLYITVSLLIGDKRPAGGSFKEPPVLLNPILVVLRLFCALRRSTVQTCPIAIIFNRVNAVRGSCFPSPWERGRGDGAAPARPARSAPAPAGQSPSTDVNAAIVSGIERVELFEGSDLSVIPKPNLGRSTGAQPGDDLVAAIAIDVLQSHPHTAAEIGIVGEENCTANGR